MRIPEKSKQKKGLLYSRPFLIVSDLLQTELLVELSNAAAGIDQLLLASEEGVTLRADFHLDITLGRTCLNHITAGASNSSLLIIGMDSFLHARVHPLSDPVYLCVSFHLTQAIINLTYSSLNCKYFFEVFYFFPKKA
jgi:hypothetical protein